MKSLNIESIEQILQSTAVPENLNFSIRDGYYGLGIIYIEMYQITSNSVYLEFAEAIASHCIHHSHYNRELDLSYLQGRSGLAYFLFHLSKIRGDERYISKILELFTPDLIRYNNDRYTNNSLYGGRAGLLLILLIIYQEYKEDNIRNWIVELYSKILSTAKVTATGATWDYHENSNIPKSSLGYGDAGIGLVLSYLATTSRDKSLNKLVQKIINNYSAQDKVNTHIHMEENGAIASSLDNYNWLFGLNGTTYGINTALRILNSTETLGEKYSQALLSEKMILSTRERLNQSLLPTDTFGISKTFSDNSIDDINDFRITNDTNISGFSLFSGTLGLIQEYLRQAYPLLSINIICPAINLPMTDMRVDFSRSKLHHLLLKEAFERTLFTLETVYPNEIHSILENLEFTDLYMDFSNKVKQLSSMKSDAGAISLREIIEIEFGKCKILETIDNIQDFSTQQINEFDKVWHLASLPNEELGKYKFQLSPFVKIINTSFNWSTIKNSSLLTASMNDPTFKAGKLFYLILFPDHRKQVLELASFAFWEIILQSFYSSNSIDSANKSIRENISRQNNFFFWQALAITKDSSKQVFMEKLDERIYFYIRHFLTLQIIVPERH